MYIVGQIVYLFIETKAVSLYKTVIILNKIINTTLVFAPIFHELNSKI